MIDRKRKSWSCVWLIALLASGNVFAQNLTAKPVTDIQLGEAENARLKQIFMSANTSTQGSIAKERTLFPDSPPASAAKTEGGVPPQSPVEGGMWPAKKSFWVSNGLMMGSTIANVEVIARCRPQSCQSIPDAIRSRSKLYAIGIPATAGVSYVSYRLKRGGSKWWIVPVVAVTAGNIVYAAHAAQWSK